MAIVNPSTPEQLGELLLLEVNGRLDSDNFDNSAWATASTISGSNAEGSSTSFARADHDHALGADVVTSTQIAADAVGSSEIAANAVGTSEIADNAVTAAKWNVGFGSAFINQMFNDQRNITATADRLYFSAIQVLTEAAFAGVYYVVAGTSNGNVRSALYDSSGTRVANRTTNSAQPGVLNGHSVAFDATYTAAPGLYFAALIFSSSTATAIGANHFQTTSAAQGSFATPSTVTAPVYTNNGPAPRMVLYA